MKEFYKTPLGNLIRIPCLYCIRFSQYKQNVMSVFYQFENEDPIQETYEQDLYQEAYNKMLADLSDWPGDPIFVSDSNGNAIPVYERK